MEQPLQNETSEDEIMHDQVGQSELENSDEDQIMQVITAQCETDLDLPEKKNTGERQGEQSNPENEIITKRSTRPTKDIRPIRFGKMYSYWQINLPKLHSRKRELI